MTSPLRQTADDLVPRDPLRERLASRIRPDVIRSLDRYARERIPTGGFLRAVLSNDLRGAFGRADADNRAALADIVSYVYNFLPAACWGSPQAVAAWLQGDTGS